jgi:arabinogalactan endo-1,4-beta-galactosidase
VGASPANGAASAARNTVVELRFSKPVAVPAGAITLVGPRGLVSASVVPNSTPVATAVRIKPDSPLGFGETYTVKARRTVSDTVGNFLAANSSSFTVKQRNPALALGGIVMDNYVRRRWTPESNNPWNALPSLVDNGMGWLRAAVTTHTWPELRSNAQWHTLHWRNEYWSCREVTGALMREAADLGMRLHAVLFLSDDAAHWGKQRLPPAWAGLSTAALAVKVEQHGREVASYYQSLGLNIEVFEIGNEIDAGAFGLLLWDTVPVPAGIDALNDPAWMRQNLWTRVAPLLQAAMRGVKSVYPAAKVMLHIAGFGYSRNSLAASAFFESMEALGVPFDLAGLSFPYMMFDQGLPQPFFKAAEFLAALDRISLLGRPIQLVEVGYNAKPQGTRVVNPPYPYTPQGQADFFRDLAHAVLGRVQSLFAFYPDWHDGMDANAPELEGLGLFSAPGVPRPALGVFNAIAERQLLV